MNGYFVGEPRVGIVSAEPPEHGIFVIHMHVHVVSSICISLSQLGTICMHACMHNIVANRPGM